MLAFLAYQHPNPIQVFVKQKKLNFKEFGGWSRWI